MAMYKCKNFGSCQSADSGEEFSLAAGADDQCPGGCGAILVRVGEEEGKSGGGELGSKRKPILLASVAGLVFLVIVGIGYKKWASGQVVVLKPDASVEAPTSTPSPSAATATPSAPAVAAVEPAIKPAPVVANEVAARNTCDEATKANQPDAAKVCRRATAITLMNSGVLSAVGGNLDAAEKDYLAAKDKDPDLAEIYFNLAVLKARQNKGSEAIENLALASAKGFKQFSAIKSEPALQKLKSDAAMKAKIEAFEAK